MEVLSDYEWRGPGGELFGVFVFACDGVLAGLEVWSIDGLLTPKLLPNISDLKPIAH